MKMNLGRGHNLQRPIIPRSEDHSWKLFAFIPCSGPLLLLALQLGIIARAAAVAATAVI